MATKKPPPGKRRKKKRKIRLSLKSSKMKKTDSYTTDVGRTLGEKPQPKEPETIRHQCTLCGAIMKVPKPKKARYTISCPHCGHEDSFN